MTIWTIIALLLVIICLAVILFGNESVSAKTYKAVSAATMAVLGVLGVKFITEGVA